MTDEIDTANDRSEVIKQAGVDAIPRYTGTSAKRCEDCDEPIPEGRRQAVPGCTRCTSCEEDEAKRNRP